MTALKAAVQITAYNYGTGDISKFFANTAAAKKVFCKEKQGGEVLQGSRDDSGDEEIRHLLCNGFRGICQTKFVFMLEIVFEDEWKSQILFVEIIEVKI